MFALPSQRYSNTLRPPSKRPLEFNPATLDDHDAISVTSAGISPSSRADEASRTRKRRKGKAKSSIRPMDSRSLRRVSSEYKANDADVVLVSSDNVAFKVHSWKLRTFSAVFEDMLAAHHSQEGEHIIDLTDHEIETNYIITAFLDIIYKSKVKQMSTVSMINLIRLADKYDCGLVFRSIEKEVEARLSRGGYPHKYFAIATNMGNHRLASMAITKSTTWSYLQPHDRVKAVDSGSEAESTEHDDDDDGYDEGRDEEECGPYCDCHRMVKPEVFGQHFAGAAVLDLGGMRYEDFCRIPLPSLWALHRATRGYTQETVDNDEETWKGIAKEYKRLMRLPGCEI